MMVLVDDGCNDNIDDVYHCDVVDDYDNVVEDDVVVDGDANDDENGDDDDGDYDDDDDDDDDDSDDTMNLVSLHAASTILFFLISTPTAGGWVGER